jgi:hypothetical protein
MVGEEKNPEEILDEADKKLFVKLLITIKIVNLITPIRVTKQEN